MRRPLVMRFFRFASLVLVALLCTSCVGTVLGVAVDTTIEVAKLPFKVAGAVVDVAVPDDDDDEDGDDE